MEIKIQTPHDKQPTGRQVAEALIDQAGMDPDAAYDTIVAREAFDREVAAANPNPAATAEKAVREAKLEELKQLGREASIAAGAVLDARAGVLLTPREADRAREDKQLVH